MVARTHIQKYTPICTHIKHVHTRTHTRTHTGGFDPVLLAKRLLNRQGSSGGDSGDDVRDGTCGGGTDRPVRVLQSGVGSSTLLRRRAAHKTRADKEGEDAPSE